MWKELKTSALNEVTQQVNTFTTFRLINLGSQIFC